jgi:type II secretory pathway pseudopilin PulG
VRRSPAFTLIEIVISIFIVLLLMMLAIPSLSGVMADRRLRRSLDSFNRLVYEAQQRSTAENRPYLLVWTNKAIELRPEVLLKADDPAPVDHYDMGKGDSITLNLTAALANNPPAQWVFWPTGNCEPADIKFAGHDGNWTASYSPLTARAQLTAYVAR